MIYLANLKESSKCNDILERPTMKNQQEIDKKTGHY